MGNFTRTKELIPSRVDEEKGSHGRVKEAIRVRLKRKGLKMNFMLIDTCDE